VTGWQGESGDSGQVTVVLVTVCGTPATVAPSDSGVAVVTVVTWKQ
jgi:hypothetical protein